MSAKGKSLGVDTSLEAVSWDVDVEPGSGSGSPMALSPKSPVQRRLEKRGRSPKVGARSPPHIARRLVFAGEEDSIALAMKRREELLKAQMDENARHVARAKEVAKKTNEDRLLEASKLAGKIQTRLLAAEARREDYLKTIREKATPRQCTGTACLDRKLEDVEAKLVEAQERREHEFERRMDGVRQHLACVKDRCDQLRLVRQVQSWWRESAQRRAIAAQFIQTDPCQKLKLIFPGESKTFDELAVHLADIDVMSATRELLDTLKPQRAGSVKSKSTLSAARTFLAALMIAAHPDTVLGVPGKSDQGGKLRRLVLCSARALCNRLRDLNVICAKPLTSRSVDAAVVRALLRVRTTQLLYTRAFVNWKQADANMLAEEMFEVFVSISMNLHDIQVQLVVNPHDPGLQQHQAGMNGQLESITARIGRLVGQRQAKAWHARAKAEIKERMESLNGNSGTTAESQAGVKVKDDRTNSKAAPKLPPRPESLFTVPSNEQMVHELMLDENYQLSVEELESKFTEMKADTEAFSRQLENGEFDVLLDVLGSIRDRLAGLCPNRKDLAAQLDERVDLVLLRQEFEAKAFDVTMLYDLVQFLGERILALQAPIRQAQTEAWLLELHTMSQERGAKWERLMPPAMDNILRELSFVDIDMANFHLQVLSANLKGTDGFNYLKSKFEQRCRIGEYQLGTSGAPLQTEKWLTCACATLMSQTQGVESHTLPPVRECIIEAILGSIMNPDVQVESDMARTLPETLRERDSKRLFEVHQRLTTFSRFAVLCIVFAQVIRMQPGADISVGSPAMTQATQELRLLANPGPAFSELVDSVTAVAERAMISAKAPQQLISVESRELLISLLNQATANGTLYNTVRRQLEQIVRKALRSNNVSCAQLLRKINLQDCEKEISSICSDLAKVSDLTQKVHDDTYVKIMKQVSADCAAK